MKQGKSAYIVQLVLSMSLMLTINSESFAESAEKPSEFLPFKFAKKVIFSPDTAHQPQCIALQPLEYTVSIMSPHDVPKLSLKAGSPYKTLMVKKHVVNKVKVEVGSYVDIATLSTLTAPITLNGRYVYDKRESFGTWSYGNCTGTFTSIISPKILLPFLS